MARSALLVSLRALSAGALVVGLLGLAVGAYATATFDCESGYYYDATTVEPDDLEGDPFAYENLSDAERRSVQAALNDSTDRETAADDLPGNVTVLTVEYRGEILRVRPVHVDCGDPGLFPAVVGAPLAVLGGLGAGLAHLALWWRE